MLTTSCRRPLLSAVLLAALALPCRAAPAPPDLDLNLVPDNAAGFVRLLPQDVWASDLLADSRALTKHIEAEAREVFDRTLGLQPADVERLTLVFPDFDSLQKLLPSEDPEGVSGVWVVRLSRPIDKDRLMKAFGLREKVQEGVRYYFREDPWSAFHLADDRTLVYGSEDSVLAVLRQAAGERKPGVLAPALKDAAGKDPLVIAFNPAAVPEPLRQAVPADFRPLLEARLLTGSVTLAGKPTLRLRLDCAGDVQARSAEQAAKALAALGREGLKTPESEILAALRRDRGDVTDTFAALYGLALLRHADAFLKDLPLERRAASLHLQVQADTRSSASSALVFVTAVTSLGHNANATFEYVGQSVNGEAPGADDPPLRRVYEALEKYRKDKGTYPPPALCGKDGTPLLSWRVAVLPYLGEEALYKEFKLDEPWDSLHNKKLLKRLPKALSGAGAGALNMRTPYEVLTADGSLFDGSRGKRREDVAAPEKTAVVARLDGWKSGVAWTRPADLSVPAAGPVLPQGANGIRVILADGTLRKLTPPCDDELRGLVPPVGKK